jgi:hypothetical protein
MGLRKRNIENDKQMNEEICPKEREWVAVEGVKQASIIP